MALPLQDVASDASASLNLSPPTEPPAPSNDLLIFVNGGKHSIRRLVEILGIYERWSGQLISKEKSAFYLSKNISSTRVSALLRLIGFREGNFSATYLGAPLVSRRLTTRIIEPLVEKVRKKVARWKFKLLSPGGRSKYLKDGHVSLAATNYRGSRLWRSILSMLPKVSKNVKVLVRGGNASFWYDRWLALGPLSVWVEDIANSKLRINECWLENCWDVERLTELVREEATMEIIQNTHVGKTGSDVFVWKPSKVGNFLTATTWEVVRKWGDQMQWKEWVWHRLLPKRISIFVWKAYFRYLAVDERMKARGVAMASSCDCCIR
ncbi:hypothetical protein F2P56_014330, partial [Juglans regia]